MADDQPEESPADHAGEGSQEAPPLGIWASPRPSSAERPAFPGAPSTAPPAGQWVAPSPLSSRFPPPPTRPAAPWQTAEGPATPGATQVWGTNGPGPAATASGPVVDQLDRRAPALVADVAAAAAVALDVGLALVLLGSFLNGLSADGLADSAFAGPFGSGFRLRLLVVFAGAAFGQASVLLLAVLITALRAPKPSPLRRPALAGAAGLGVYVGMAALLRALACFSFLGRAPGLAAGAGVTALAAVPVALAATVWAAILLTRPEDPGTS